jgi:hypothetical protein
MTACFTAGPGVDVIAASIENPNPRLVGHQLVRAPR